jgi:hypothetical protein
MFKKRLLAALAFVACVQHVNGNIFTNIIKTLVGYGAAKVDQGIAYVDQIWFNVEQDLYKPMEQANNLYGILENNKQHLALHGNDQGFSESITTVDEGQRAIKNLLYLMEQKKVAFTADPKKSLHCFKLGIYSAADQNADATELQGMIDAALADVEQIQSLVRPVLQKTYARNKDKRTLLDLIRGNEHNGSFVEKKVDEIKRVVWGQLCNNNTSGISVLLHSDTQDKAISELADAFNKEITDEKDAAKKKDIIAKKDAFMALAQHTKTICFALDLYKYTNTMIQYLRKLQSPVIDTTLIKTMCVAYHNMLVNFNEIDQEKQNVNTENMVSFVKNDEQFTHEMLTNRSIVVAKNMEDGLINGKLIDPTISNAKLLIGNPALVKTSVLSLVTTALQRIKKMKTSFNKLDCIGHQNIAVPGFGKKTVAGHFAALIFINNEEYVDFAGELTKLLEQTVYQKNTPIHLLNRYAEAIKQYAELVSLEKRLKLLKKMSNGTGTVLQIDSLLINDKRIHTAYEKFKKEKGIFDKNKSVSKLQLNSDDITLDALCAYRGETFNILKNRLGVSQSSSWEAASTIVTAGENAYAAYTNLIESCHQVLNLTGGFDFDGLINRSLHDHVNIVIAAASDADKDSKDAVLANLALLNQAFITAIDKGNFTDAARVVIKEVASIYINTIKSALKAQVIAAWYTHDIAWKMENATLKGLKKSVLEGLRKLTPTCGKTVTLEVIS